MVKVKDNFTYISEGHIDLNAWIEKISHTYSVVSIDTLKKAAIFSQQLTEGLTTFYGQPCIEQGLEMAEIMLSLKLDPDAIVATILTPTLQQPSFTFEQINEDFGENITKLLKGFQQINLIQPLKSTLEKQRGIVQKDRLRKAFLAMASDLRVILIKLAERTVLMRGIKKINPHSRKQLAQETMDLYAPLANRLGIGQLKWELEDFAFHYLKPETYKFIANFLAERRVDRERDIHFIIDRLKEYLAEAQIKADLSGRAKHIYSIYLKMLRKHIDLKNIYDFSAIRILVPTIADCYTTLSLVHRLWEHIPEEFDDYIANPKPNGYRSIHTAVIGPGNKNFEIQIRTYELHEAAEHGVAAHWIYKEDKNRIVGDEAKITLLREVLAWHKELAKQEETPNQKLESLFEDQVYIFTPAGDIIDLPKGATPLDFAYNIHTEVGNKCRGAKINGHIVPLTYELKTGDRVEIITAKNATPSRDWLLKDSGYLKTPRARAKVAAWFRHIDTEEEKPVVPIEREQKAKKKTTSTSNKEPKSVKGLAISGIPDLLTRIAKCCKPIPGDNIIGFITQGRGVSIHKNTCKNISLLNVVNENKLINVNWDKELTGAFYVDLQITASQHDAVLKEITSLLANAKIQLITLNSTNVKKRNNILITLTLKIQHLTELDQLITNLRHLPHIISVSRINS